MTQSSFKYVMLQAVGRQKLAQAKGAFCAPAGLGNEFPNNTSAESAADNQQEKIMSQSLSQLYIHIVFSTKHRHPYLADNQLRDRLYQYINKICIHYQCHLLAVGGISDHIHLLISLNKKISASKIIEKIKTSTSKWIKSTHINLRHFYWQNGYGAFSVSQSSIDAVIKYIENQENHHKTLSFKDELKKLLLAYKINYDEKYL